MDFTTKINGKAETVQLDQHAAFMLCCFELGRFYNPENTTQATATHMENVSLLSKLLNEDQRDELADIYRQFDNAKNRNKLTEHGQNLLEDFKKEFQKLLKQKA